MNFDVVIIGAGAAGLFCAGVAGQRGLKVLLVDHSEKVAEKIRISGGGRANFTNRDIDVRAPHKHFISDNPNFCRSALSRYTPQDFIALMQRHSIPFHEKHKGQLFCDRSAGDLINMLLAECTAGGVERWQPCAVHAVRGGAQNASEAAASAESDAPATSSPAHRFEIDTDRGTVLAHNVVVATGGLSIPKIGATDFGYRLAKQFGLGIVPLRPALVPLTFDSAAWQAYSQLAGLSLPVRIETGSKKARRSFDEDLLFTHRGLSGPGVLQISSYWQPGTAIRLDLLPTSDIEAALLHAKSRSRKLVVNELAALLPQRLADAWVQQDAALQRPVAEAPDKALTALASRLAAWEIVPSGTEGYAKAEVTAGGVDTREISSQSMESRVPGLHFIGEVVDVTGWLGGYNFQWAWASGFACGQALAPAPQPA